MAETAARDFMAAAEVYLGQHLGIDVRSYDATLSAVARRRGTETPLGDLPIDAPGWAVQVCLHFDGGAETRVVGGHMLALGEIADLHGAAILPMRLEPEHPAEGEPFTMILTYHFTEGTA